MLRNKTKEYPLICYELLKEAKNLLKIFFLLPLSILNNKKSQKMSNLNNLLSKCCLRLNYWDR